MKDIEHMQRRIRELHMDLTKLLPAVTGEQAMHVQDACNRLVVADIELEKANHA